MNFQTIPPVDGSHTQLDIALKAAAKRVAQFKQSLRHGDALERQMKIERERLKEVAKQLSKSLSRIPKSFPNLEGLPEFYARMFDAVLDTEALRGSLASVSTAAKNLVRLAGELGKEFARVSSRKELLKKKRVALGRVASVVKRLDKDLSRLENARKVLRTFPDIKTDLFTVAIAGFPNVGKSTLLGKLTGAKPEINEYAFTTKTLNTGTFTYRYNKIQCIDTPGTLDRPEKMNDIEKQAYLAMKYAAHVIVYVYDLTEPYPLQDQKRLEAVVRKYGKDVFLYLSKIDILHPDARQGFDKVVITDIELLKEKLTENFETDFL